MLTYKFASSLYFQCSKPQSEIRDRRFASLIQPKVLESVHLWDRRQKPREAWVYDWEIQHITDVISPFNYLSQLLVTGLSPIYQTPSPHFILQAQELDPRVHHQHQPTVSLPTCFSRQMEPFTRVNSLLEKSPRWMSAQSPQGRPCGFLHCMTATSLPAPISRLGSSPVSLAWVGLIIPLPSLRGSTESRQQILTFPRPQFFRYSAGNPLGQHGCFLWSSSFSQRWSCLQ